MPKTYSQTYLYKMYNDYEKKLFGDGTRLPMNDVHVMVPVEYHGLLKAKGYGNYMEFPPPVCRKPSHTAKGCGVIW